MASPRARELYEAEERALLARLDPDETVLARGRFDELDRPPRSDLPTGGYWYLLVTNRRILWKDTSVELATATGYREVTQFHRYAIRLRHAPVERRERAPAHRVLWWHWGNTTRLIRATETGFAFSHRDTDAARAIRGRLSALGVEATESIRLPRTRPRDEGRAYLQEVRPSRRRRQSL